MDFYWVFSVFKLLVGLRLVPCALLLAAIVWVLIESLKED